MIPLGLVLLTLSIGFFVWRIETRYRVVLTPILLLLVYFALRILPGYIYAVEVKGIGNELAYLVYITALLSMVLGWLLTIQVYGPSEGRITGIRGLPLESDGILSRAWMWLLIITMLIFGYLLYRGLPPSMIPLVELARGGDITDAVASVADARRDLTKSHLFGGAYKGQGVLRESIFVGGALIGCYFLARYLRRRTYASLLVFFAVILMLYGLISGDGTRGTFLLLFISLVITTTLVTRVTVSRMLLILFGFICLGILLGAFTPKMNDLIASEGFRAAVFALVERIAIGNSINDVIAIEAFGAGSLNTGYGTWFFRDLVSALPGAAGGKPLAYYLFLVTPGGTGTTTYLTGTHIMSAYGDFGLAGVGLYFFLIGACTAFAAYLIRKLPRTELGMAVAGVATMLVGQFYVAGMVGVSVQILIAAVLVLPVFIFKYLKPLPSEEISA